MLSRQFATMVFLLFFSGVALADIEWYEPEVLRDSKVVDGRRDLRFSGLAQPGTAIRLKKNRIRTFLEDGSFRWVTVSSRDRQQFPVQADGDGSFSFILKLPLQPIELPLEINEDDRGWRPSTLNFRVPQTGGTTNDLDLLEESYSAANTLDDDAYDRASGDYKSAEDIGQIIERRQQESESRSENTRERIRTKTLNLKVHAGLGPAWVSLSQDMPDVTYNIAPPAQALPAKTGLQHDKNEFSIPSWRLGLIYEHSSDWRFEVTLRDTPMQFEPEDDDYEVTFPTGQASWTESQLGATYFLKDYSFGQLGIDFGFQYHSLPYYRFREGTSTFVYFDANAYNVFAGARLRSSRDRQWPWEAYARVVVPFVAGEDVFDGSGFGLEVGGGADRELMPGVYAGVWGYGQWFSLDTEFENTFASTGPGATSQVHEVGYSVLMFSVEGRLTFRF